MFYVPYKFKSQVEPTTPRGPNFLRAPTISTTIDGTRISMKLPRHKTTMSAGYLSPKKTISLTDRHFVHADSKKFNCQLFNFVSRIWDFNGHNFFGRVALFEFVGYVMKVSTQKKDTSFFHPAFFENTISDYLSEFYCGHEDRYDENESYKSIYQAPVNWSVLEFGNGLQGVRFNVIKSSDFSTGAKKTYVFIPISDNYILKFVLELDRNVNLKNNMPIDDWINPKYCDELCENIIDSININLSEEAKKQRELALQGVANPKLSETFAPIDWPKDGVLKEKFDIESDDGWGEYS